MARDAVRAQEIRTAGEMRLCHNNQGVHPRQGRGRWRDGVVVVAVSLQWHNGEVAGGVSTVAACCGGGVTAARPGTTKFRGQWRSGGLAATRQWPAEGCGGGGAWDNVEVAQRQCCGARHGGSAA
jgi:hypothetical protein